MKESIIEYATKISTQWILFWWCCIIREDLRKNSNGKIATSNIGSWVYSEQRLMPYWILCVITKARISARVCLQQHCTIVVCSVPWTVCVRTHERLSFFRCVRACVYVFSFVYIALYSIVFNVAQGCNC